MDAEAHEPLAALVREMGELSRQHLFDGLPPRAYPHMYVAVHDRAALEAAAGFPLPDELVTLWSTAVFCTEPWSGIRFEQPAALKDACDLGNGFVQEGPPMKAGVGVREPVRFGPGLVPFATHDDSALCLDEARQVVNVSWRKGQARVAAASLQDFLAKGVEKWKREIRKERRQAGTAVDPQGAAAMAEMLREPFAYFDNLRQQLQAMIPAPAPAAHQRTAEQRGEDLTGLLARNPRQTPLQQACAELLEACAQDPELQAALEFTQPPLSHADVADLEQSLQVRFPPDLREFLAVHARLGAPWDNISTIGVDKDLPLLCRELRGSSKGVDWALWPGTRPPRFGPGLLPLAGDGDPVVCYDLQPGDGGSVGQIVAVDFEQAQCKVIAASLLAFLQSGIERLRRPGS